MGISLLAKARKPKIRIRNRVLKKVGCCVGFFLKKRGAKKEEEKDSKEAIEAQNVNNNVARKEKTRDLNLVAAYSSSGSSGVTDAACGYGSGRGSGSGEHEDETGMENMAAWKTGSGSMSDVIRSIHIGLLADEVKRHQECNNSTWRERRKDITEELVDSNDIRFLK
ncbi:hypothetical protein Tco_1117138 [Tanacetum coccineum]